MNPEADRDCVYKPAEDTWLLVEAFENAYPIMSATCGKPRSIADIGTGSGVIARRIASSIDAKVLAIDISPYAISASARFLAELPEVLVLHCNAGNCVGSVDIAIFNPPYLPEGEPDEEAILSEQCGGWLKAAFTSPEAMAGMCHNASTIARCGVVAVYSTLSPVDLEACLAEHGMRIVHTIEESYFFERLRAIVAVHREPRVVASEDTPGTGGH